MMRINRWNTPIILIIRLCQMPPLLFPDSEELLFNEAGNLIEYTAKRPGAL